MCVSVSEGVSTCGGVSVWGWIQYVCVPRQLIPKICISWFLHGYEMKSESGQKVRTRYKVRCTDPECQC